MKVLMITADKQLFVEGTPPYERLQLQKKYADIVPVFWGHGSLLAPFGVKGDFDVVTVQDPFWRGIVGLIISFYKKARFNVQVHTDLFAQSFMRRALAHVVLGQADSIRVVSNKLKTQVERLDVVVPIKVLPIFLDIERLTAIPRSEGYGDTKTILWVGRFEVEKDPARAIDILKEVRQKGVDAELVMLGAGSLKEKLEQKANGLPITFPGWSDPAPYLASADVVLNTSHYEGYGASIVEALAVGVPVVSPDVGVAQEAGAVIAPREGLATAVVLTLNSGVQGELKIPILSSDEWGKQWSETLEY
jgi:glycosyltransferase involved in cell wall biosynthesis